MHIISEMVKTGPTPPLVSEGFLAGLWSVMLLLIAALVISRTAGYKSYHNYSLVAVTCQNEDQVQYLESVERDEIESGEFGVDLWQRPLIGRTTDVLVKGQCRQDFLTGLIDRRVPFVIVLQDVGTALEMERPSGNWRDGSDKFLNLQEIEDHLHTLQAKYHRFVQLESIGTTFENRTITLVKVTRKGLFHRRRRAIWIDAGIHAREWIAPATVMHIINKLVTEKALARYLDKFQWFFVPVLNPDGYHYSHTVDRMWRKNRRRGPCRCLGWAKYCCDGVDLNRNFDFHWGGVGASKNPCDNTYRGPAAFSEKESAAVRDYLLHKSNNRTFLYITLHSYGQLWTYPYSDKENSYSNDHDEVDRVAKMAIDALEKQYGSKYRVGTGADILYSATGSSADWVKAVANVNFVYGIELRPDNDKGRTGFLVPPQEISQSGEELWAAIREVVDEIANTGLIRP